jgi:hypothetical protein
VVQPAQPVVAVGLQRARRPAGHDARRSRRSYKETKHTLDYIVNTACTPHKPVCHARRQAESGPLRIVAAFSFREMMSHHSTG